MNSIHWHLLAQRVWLHHISFTSLSTHMTVYHISNIHMTWQITPLIVLLSQPVFWVHALDPHVHDATQCCVQRIKSQISSRHSRFQLTSCLTSNLFWHSPLTYSCLSLSSHHVNHETSFAKMNPIDALFSWSLTPPRSSDTIKFGTPSWTNPLTHMLFDDYQPDHYHIVQHSVPPSLHATYPKTTASHMIINPDGSYRLLNLSPQGRSGH